MLTGAVQPTGVVCGERIGVYERIDVDLGNGRIIRSSLLALSNAERRSARAYWHEHCAGPARPPDTFDRAA